MKKTMKKIFLWLIVSIVVLLMLAQCLGCRREDWRTCTIQMPALVQTDKPKVEAALSLYGGIQKSSYQWDFDKRTLTLVYDSMQIAQTNIRRAIEAVGVPVTDPQKSGPAGFLP